MKKSFLITIFILLLIFTICNINNDNMEITNKNVEYTCKDKLINNKTFINETLQLTNEYKNGNVSYSNKSSNDVTLLIPEINFKTKIPAYSERSEFWVKDGISNKTYTISVSSDGSINLNGNLSVSKSNFEVNNAH